ncbi:Disintegrin and metalloproteinase domain-containing protein 9 [Larimichthys crocea]|nr:Disintegrin and metalloproteinase domain-containing protein 9 [Larimichthys crocea]
MMMMMMMGGRVKLLEICCLLLLLSGNSQCRDSEQTEHLSSYQLTVPRPIGGRLRRDVDGKPPNQVSYVISVDGNDRVVHLERNEGVLHLTDDSYGIEPLDSAPEQHLVYRLQDVTSQPKGCGTPHDDEHNHNNATEHAQKKSFGGTAGMAFVSTVCSRSHGGGINAFTNNNVPSFASIVAHELGHNLGMNHDDGRSCTGSRNFSSCSADDFEKMILLTGGSCLLNVPRPDEAYSAPFCGNRLVDMGEECDCGSQANGQPCRNSQAFCYNGKCQHYDGQCQAIFGSSTSFTVNALCGKLQCSNVQAVTVFGIEPSIITTPILGTKCYGVDFMLGSDVPDPGMVNEGTKCGDNKVCNSNRNCHCDDGWAAPFCEVKGYGGSVDSGPTWNDKDTSLRDGLLVFFFFILPLLALGAFVFVRRNELLRRLGLSRRKRSQGYQADGVASANPSRGPPPRAQPPSVARGNANNIVRDGHHAQLLPPQEVVETSRSAPSYALRPPPPPLKPKPAAASQPLVPQRPAPAPPV